MTSAHVVIDLGFGDAGKGLLVDWLVRETGAKWVARFNGGSQAGHNVVAPDGVHHTFSQFGAGSLVPGVRTFLSRHVLLHPLALLVEAEVLAPKLRRDPLGLIAISERARLITPFHQALNRLRELVRGEARHGSCGVGVGETVAHALAHPAEALVAADLRQPEVARAKLRHVRLRLLDEWRKLTPKTFTEAMSREASLLEEPEVEARWFERARVIAARVVTDDALAGAGAVVFEGAQGVLLDEAHGFHPHTTWTRCTAANALELIPSGANVTRYGVLRCYGVRHGPGPFPTEDDRVRAAVRHDHNAGNDWQGQVRYGWFDAALAQYALKVTSGVDQFAVTHLDALPRLGEWRAATSYEADWTPVYERCAAAPEEVLRAIERLVGRRVDLASHGPTPADVQRLG